MKNVYRNKEIGAGVERMAWGAGIRERDDSKSVRPSSNPEWGAAKIQ